jgi:hypothetical protein
MGSKVNNRQVCGYSKSLKGKRKVFVGLCNNHKCSTIHIIFWSKSGKKTYLSLSPEAFAAMVELRNILSQPEEAWALAT